MSSLDLMRVVAADTWLDVLDRKKPQRGGWNLLEDTSTHPPRVLAIDYGMCLTEVLGGALVRQPMKLRCPDEWRHLLRTEDVAASVKDVNDITESTIHDVVDAVPEDWRAGVRGLDMVPAYLVQRQAELEACLRRELDL